MSEAIRKLEHQKGSDPTDNEIAAEMGISLSEYHQILVDSSSARIFSMDAIEDDHGDYQMPQSSEQTPLDSVSEDEYQHNLVESIKGLPERERLVMSLYYDDELNFREIGRILEVSESRVCQIHGQAMLRLQSKMSDWRREE